LLGAAGVALSRCYRESGRLDLSIAVAEEVRETLNERGMRGLYEYVMLIVGSASAYYEKDDLNQARRLCTRAIAVAEESGSNRACAASYWEASMLEYDAGQTERALALTARAMALLEADGTNRNVALLRSLTAFYNLELPEPDLAQAHALFEIAARELEWSAASPVDMARNLLGHARVSLARGDDQAAGQMLDRISDAAEMQMPSLAVVKALLRGHHHASRTRNEAASRCYDEACDLLTLLASDRDTAHLWFELADAREALGQLDKALDAYRIAGVILGGEKPRRRSHRSPMMPVLSA
ncbi:MAG: hypothetical protein ACRCYU_22905, partial [Nocardioides sp.]